MYSFRGFNLQSLALTPDLGETGNHSRAHMEEESASTYGTVKWVESGKQTTRGGEEGRGGEGEEEREKEGEGEEEREERGEG